MTVLRAYRSLLGNRPLVRLLAGEFVSSIGDWLYLVALLIVIYERGATTAVLGVVGAARILPYVFLSVPAGIVADRFDRRKVLLVTDVARGLVMIALTWLVASGGSLVAIVGLTILATCFSAFFGPAIGSYLPSLVRDERELGPANSAYASLDNLAFIIGPAVAAVLIAFGGLTTAFVLNAITFGFVAAVLWTLPSSRATPARAGPGDPDPPDPPDVGAAATAPEPPERSIRALLAGPGVLRPLIGISVMDLAGGFAFGGIGVLTVVLAVDVLHAGEEGTGALNAAIGLGGLIGALTSGALVLRRSLTAPLIGGAALLCAGLVLLGSTQSLAVALAASVITASGAALVGIVSTTLFQRIVPDEVRGRVLGGIETVSVTSYAAGSLFVPVLSEPLGIGTMLIACGVLMAIGTLIGVALIGRALGTAAGVDPVRGRLARSELFAGLPAARLEAAMRAARVESVEAGTVVIRQGDTADRFYVIVEGSVTVTQTARDGELPRILRTMGPGESFGELGLLTGAPRSATVTAAEPLTLLALDGPDFLELVGASPDLTSRLLTLHLGVPGASG